jgi:hypothetical protein
MTTVDNILKEVYEPQLTDQLQSEIKTISRLSRSTDGIEEDNVGGKYVRFPIRVTRNHGVGARNEMEALPVAKTQGYESAQIKLKYLYGAIQLTGQVIKLAETKVQAFVSALDQEVNGMRETLAKDTNRQAYGTTEGRLAVASAGAAGRFDTLNAQYLEIGMIVDLYDGAAALQEAAARISAIVLVGATYQVSLVVDATGAPIGDTPAATWFLTRAGSRNKEKTGFDSIILGTGGDGTGALYNITHAVWTGNVDSTVSAISESRMINMVDRIRNRGGKVTVGFTSRGVRRAYFNLLTQQRRFINQLEFTGGFKGLAFTTDDGDIPIVSDFDCQPGRMYFINEDEIKLYQAGDWSFMDMDGSRWNRVVTAAGTFDAYAAHLHKYCEMGTNRRNSHGVLTNVAEA